MAEWSKAAVSKTVNGVTRSGVRIPFSPPFPPILGVRRRSNAETAVHIFQVRILFLVVVAIQRRNSANH